MNKQIRIFFAGDFCSKPSTSRITVSDELKSLIQSCDLKVVNFEVPLKPNVELPPQKRERFFQNDDAPDFLRGLGFNLFSLANNHAFDWDEEGFKKTKAALGDQSFGAGTYNEAYKPKIVEVNGVKIGFLSVCFAAYKGVFDDVDKHDGLGCAYINDLRVNHDIIEAKKHVDYLFVLSHDGIEYIDLPLPETIARYRDFIDYGADGVIGTHPHCPQGWEIYKNKPIFYSLGNFLFNSKENYEFRANCPHWYEGMCVVLTVYTDSKLTYEIINSRNVDNQEIIIDHSEERRKHNEYLCQLLADKKRYEAVLEKERNCLCKRSEMPIIDHTFHDYGLKLTTVLFVKYIIKYIIKGSLHDDRELFYLLKNDTRRSVLTDFVKKQIKLSK
jgi:poly-gamma-glutamate synthesis protein (capsule biosynthesis protein)